MSRFADLTLRHCSLYEPPEEQERGRHDVSCLGVLSWNNCSLKNGAIESLSLGFLVQQVCVILCCEVLETYLMNIFDLYCKWR